MNKLILLISVFSTIVCSGSNSSTLDSLQNLLQKKASSSQRFDILMKIAQQKLNAGDHHCLEFAEDALMLADSINNKEKIAEASLISGQAWRLCSDNSTAILKLYRAADLFEELNNKIQYANSIKEIGETYRANGNYQLSLEYLNNALSIFKELNYSSELSNTYNRIAALKYEQLINEDHYQALVLSGNTNKEELQTLIDSFPSFQRDYDSTLMYLDLSNRYLKINSSKPLEISNTILRGALYSLFFEFQKADSVLSKAQQLALQENDQGNLSLVYFNFALLRRSMKLYDDAINFSLKAFDIAEQQGIRVYRLINANLLGDLYQRTNKPSEAIKFINIAQTEIARFYKYDLGLEINAIKFKNDLDKRKVELQFQSTKNRYIVTFFISISSLFLVFLLIIVGKNGKLFKLNRKLESSNRVIAKQNSDLQRLNEEKDKFFSIIAHDLRGPMGTFVSIADIITEELKKGKIEKVQMLAANLQIVSYHLYGLLENLLDWSRIQRGAIIYTEEKIKLRNFVINSTGVIIDGAVSKGVTVNIDIDDLIIVKTDSHMLQTVLRNLLSNAIKFTPSGGSVTVAAKHVKDTTEISVEDTGIGMTAEMLGELFKLNNSLGRLGTNYEPSTGLGLILCKDFVDKMGAEIKVESEVGRGSRFTISIP